MLIHNPSSTTIELSKEPDLPLGLARSFDQDVLRTDSGVRKVFTRRIRLKKHTIQLKDLNHNDRRLLEQFFDEVVLGQEELFDIELVVDRQAPLQVGSLQDGNPILVGTILPEDCGAPIGSVQVGDWVRQDRRRYPNCRFDQKEMLFNDNLPFNSTTRLQIIQEIP